jgi:peptidyl-prolyl cis-trans isomerase SurA
MSRRLPIRPNSLALAAPAAGRSRGFRGHAPRWCGAWVLACAMLILTAPAIAQSAAPVQLDSVVAVVNRQVILSSDIDDDMELSILDPAPRRGAVVTRRHALEELISRALIEQQIRQDDLPAIEPSASAVAARVEEIRKELPACVRAQCSTDAGWKAFLAAHDLSQWRVENYVRNRMEILSFIEERFRQGIQISDQQIETYYEDTLLPQYPPGVTAPALGQVRARIQEILLEQQVNKLFDAWLENLRTQGDVEILDPSLEQAQAQANRGGESE